MTEFVLMCTYIYIIRMSLEPNGLDLNSPNTTGAKINISPDI